MNDDDSRFEVGTAKELAAKYGLTAKNRPRIKLDPNKVPQELHPLIPYAEVWGVSDDLIRDDIVEKAGRPALDEFFKIKERLDRAMYEWLCGPIAEEHPLSAEYIAFSAMGMAYEYARVTCKLEDKKNE